MIQYYKQLKSELHRINSTISNQGQIQKIYSTARFVCLTIRFPGNTRYFYLGRGGGFEGIWEGNIVPPSELRLVDKFLEYFRKHLSASSFVGFRLCETDRVLIIPYVKAQHENLLMLFWAGRELYFLNKYYDFESDKHCIFLSWRGQSSGDVENPLALFKEVGLRAELFDTESEKNDAVCIEELLEDEKKMLTNSPVRKKAEKQLNNKIQKIKGDLERAEKWKLMTAEISKGDFNLETGELTLYTWKFKFPSKLGHYKKLELVYGKIKNLKKACQILDKRLEDANEKLSSLDKTFFTQDARKAIAPVWFRKKAEKEIQEKSELAVKTYNFKSGDVNFKCGIGLSAQGNDQLRSLWASKDDMWFHIDGGTSAHLIVKTTSESFTEDVYRIIASVLAIHSGYDGEWIPIVFTQVKNIKGVKSKAGKVLYKKEKHYLAKFNHEWKKFMI